MCASALGRNLFVVSPRVLFRYMFTRTHVCVCVLLCTHAWEWLGRPRAPGDERSHRVDLLSVSAARCGFARVFTAARDAVPSAELGVVRLLLNRPHPPALFTRAEARLAFPVF